MRSASVVRANPSRVVRVNPSQAIYAMDLRPGDTIQMEDIGRTHVIQGPYRSGRGVRFLDMYGNSIILRPNEPVRLLSRENPKRKKARKNPVQELLQTHVWGPGHAALEWVDVDDGVWVDSSKIATPAHRPPRKPGKYLVAPGAQLIFMESAKDAWKSGNSALLFTRSLFVKHKHHWKYLAPNGPEIRAGIGSDGRVKLFSQVSKQDMFVLNLMLAYVAYEAKEHGLSATSLQSKGLMKYTTKRRSSVRTRERVSVRSNPYHSSQHRTYDDYRDIWAHNLPPETRMAYERQRRGEVHEDYSDIWDTLKIAVPVALGVAILARVLCGSACNS